MRTLTATLTAAQKSGLIIPLVKAAIDGTDYTKTRIWKIAHDEEKLSQKATVVLENSDGALSDLDLKGLACVLSYGAKTTDGDEYSACAPLTIINQEEINSLKSVKVVLTMEGIFDLLARDEAVCDFLPATNNSYTVKSLIQAICGAYTPHVGWHAATAYSKGDYVTSTSNNGYAYVCTVAGTSHAATEPTWPTTLGETVVDNEVTWECKSTSNPFAGMTAYTVEFDSEDSLIDSYTPKDAFRIYTGGTRLSSIKRLLDFTNCAMRVEADGHIHIFVPTTTGTSYNYTYSLASGNHNFFSKAYRNSLVLPNDITVKSQPDDAGQYSGNATSAASNALLPKKKTIFTYLASNDEGASIAAAMIARMEIEAEQGSGLVPINAGQEVYDYIQITDSIVGDTRTGNIGWIHRRYNAEERDPKKMWGMSFGFGKSEAEKQIDRIMSDLKASGGGQVLERLAVKDLYAENINAENINLAWIDPDGNIDLSNIGDTLDSLPDGTTYARVKSTNITSGNIYLDENIVYKSGYDPTTKLPDGTTLDGIAEGTTYQRLLATDISSGHIKLTSSAVWNGDVEVKSGVVLSSTKGILLYGTATALRTRATAEGADQCYVGSDGAIYAGAGTVKLDANGLVIKGQKITFQDSNGVERGKLFGDSLGSNFTLTAVGNFLILPGSGSGLIVDEHIYAYDSGVKIGDGAYPFAEIHGSKLYATSRLKIPVGTDLYD